MRNFFYLLFCLMVCSFGATAQDCGTSFGPFCYDQTSTLIPLAIDICPDAGNAIELTFTAGQVENTWDELQVFCGAAGSGSGGTQAYSGYGASGDVTTVVVTCGADECASVYINSDGSVTCATEAYESIEFDAACVVPPAAPANNDCATPAPLAVESGTACAAPVAGADVGLATYEAGTTCTTGGGDAAKDVWYSIVVPDNGEVTIETGGDMDTVMEAFDGCGGTSLACDDDGGVGVSSLIALTNLVPGNTVLVRVWEYLNDENEAWTICAYSDIVVLPAELSTFEAEADDKMNVVSWKTASEAGVLSFDIERSLDGKKGWTTIGNVDAEGTLQAGAQYQFMDKSPAQMSYYRLVTIDLDGSEDRSEIVAVEREAKSGFDIASVYPQPVRDQLTVVFNSDYETDVEVNVYNLMGQRVLQTFINAQENQNALSVEMGAFFPGVYVITLDNGQELIKQKLIKE